MSSSTTACDARNLTIVGSTAGASLGFGILVWLCLVRGMAKHGATVTLQPQRFVISSFVLLVILAVLMVLYGLFGLVIGVPVLASKVCADEAKPVHRKWF